MNNFPQFKYPLYGFLFFPRPGTDFPKLSPDASYFLDELLSSDYPSFYVFDIYGDNQSHHFEVYLNAALELSSAGLLINTNISYN